MAIDSKALEDEVNDLDFSPGEVAEGLDVGANPEPEEVKTEEPVLEEPVVVEAPKTQEPVAQPAQTPEVQPTLVVPETSRVEELVKQVETLSQQILQMKAQAPVTTPPSKESAPQAQPTEAFDYLDGLDLDDVTTDPKLFNNVLSKIESRIRGAIAEETTRSTLMAIPDVVQYQIKQQAALDELVREFYDGNQDLKPVKHTVAMVAQNIASEHPDWTVKQVFEESAVKTREILKLNIPGGVTTTTEPLKPAFADHAKAHSKTNVKLSELQKQLDEL